MVSAMLLRPPAAAFITCSGPAPSVHGPVSAPPQLLLDRSPD